MRTTFFTLLVLVGVLVPAQAALAEPPPNDLGSAATKITAIPFTETIDTTDATASGPRFCTNNASVFYAFEPAADLRVQFDTFGSDYDTTVAVYTRDGAGKVHPLRCNDDRAGVASGVRLRAEGGVEYIFQVGRCCGSGENGGGQLTVHLAEMPVGAMEFSVEIVGPGTVDPATGMATISGTATCNRSSLGGFEGVLRQLRDGRWVARGYVYLVATCVPGAPSPWSVEVDTSTGVAFGPGSAVIRLWYQWATDGWAYTEAEGTETTIALISRS
ncbi:MAG TPA: hypothetical protein VFZ96_01630 [Actinomycetota bacterium]|nr:hypothetical protein [Actinomycetota bacterium]